MRLMAIKLIYFVRHGETINNAMHIKQGSKGPLSPKGKEQAYETAKRFPTGKGRPDLIVASPYERTRETAEIIGKVLNMKVKYSDLLVERRNPSGIVGHEAGETEVRRVLDQMDKSYHPDDLRMAYIKSRRAKRIIMVTHSRFLKMVASYMEYGDELTASEYNTLSYFNPIDNASMCICSYTHHWFKKDEWKVLVWNDLS
jgi:broad specificity phosphatase PhoE